MWIEISRYSDGRLKVIVHHQGNSYFWKSNLTECLTFLDEKDKLEALLMVDWWNRKHHRDFEVYWNYLRGKLSNIYK